MPKHPKLENIANLDEFRRLRHQERVDRRDLGIRLAACRIAQGISQSVLGAQTSITHALISQIESGKASPSIAVLKRLCLALSISSDLLLGLKETKGGQQ